MSTTARSAVRGLLRMSVAATLACADSTPAEPRISLIDDATAATVSVLNDGTVPMTSLKVRTSDADRIPTIASLNPGQTAGPFRVAVMHSYPIVEVIMDGRTVIANPVEGFAGFNPPLAPGTYLIRMRPASEPTLDIRVGPATP